MDWLNGWNNGKKITIPANSIDADLQNIPIPVYLNSSNFDFSQAKTDGSDIRFTDKNLNFLKFERVEHGAVPTEYSADLAVGGSVLYNTQDATYTAVKAFDTLDSTYWSCTQSGTEVSGVAYIGYCFATEHHVRKFSILTSSVVNRNINSVKVQNSVDGSTWNTVETISLSTSASTVQTFNLPISSAARYWRLLANGNPASTYTWFVPNVEFMEATAFSNQAKYNVLLPQLSDLTDTEFYMWYGNANAYNTSIEAWQDMTGKQIAYNGNVKLVPNVAKFGKAGYFDGTGDYITVPASSDFDFGTGAFTVRGSLYFSTMQTYNAIIGHRDSDASANVRWSIFTSNTDSLTAYIKNTTGDVEIGTITHQDKLITQTINAYALVRNGNIITLYLNGIASTTTLTTTQPIGYSAVPLRIGNFGTSAVTNMLGYMDELEVAKGIARYTTNYIPEQTPFVADAYTKLLMHFDAAPFVDETGKTVTTYGNAVPIKTAYADGARSAYFDGSGDYFSLATSTVWGIGASDFVFACRVMKQANGVLQFIYSRASSGGTDVTSDFDIYFTTSNTVGVGFSNGTTTYSAASTNTLTDLSSFHYFELNRIGNTVRLFVDGVQWASVTVSGSMNSPTTSPRIGMHGEHAYYYLNGYMSGAKLSKETGNSASYTPPTGAFSVDSNTLFCSNFDTVYDASYAMIQQRICEYCRHCF